MDKPIIKTKIIEEVRQDNRDELKNDKKIWLPTVIHDYGTWSASWDMVSYSQEEADANMQILLNAHPLK